MMQFILCYSIQEVNEILAFWDFLEFLHDILGITIYEHFGGSEFDILGMDYICTSISVTFTSRIKDV